MHLFGRRLRPVVRPLLGIAFTLVVVTIAVVGLRHDRTQFDPSVAPVANQLDELEAEGPCSAGRWPVKTLVDPGARDLVLSPIPTSVHDLGALQRPTPGVTDATGRLPEETHVAAVTATLYADHLEADLDIHLVLRDPASPNATMIAEFPDARCTAKADPALRALMTKARADYVQACGPSSGAQGNYYVQGTAQVTGVRLFDTIVGQFGRAPNAIELHPVLSFRIVGPCRKLGGSTRFGVVSSIGEGSTLHGLVSWTATVDQPAAKVTSLAFLVDGAQVGATQTGNQGRMSTDTRSLADGPHAFAVDATLADGSAALLVNHVQTQNGVVATIRPSITITPKVVRRGRSIVVRLRAFAPRTTVVVSVGRLRRRLTTASARSGSAGTGSALLRIPRTTPAGSYVVTACADGCASMASARLSIQR